jgi:hypothetical protein
MEFPRVHTYTFEVDDKNILVIGLDKLIGSLDTHEWDG